MWEAVTDGKKLHQINHISSSPYLYHYTSEDSLIKYILPKNQLRLSPITKTNDPYEVAGYFADAAMITPENAEDVELYYSLVFDEEKKKIFRDKFNREFKKNLKLICFAQDGYYSNQIAPQKNSKSLLIAAGVSIADKAFNRPRMWAQYANNNKGACLILDRSEVLKEAKKQTAIFAGPIRYIHPHELIEIRSDIRPFDCLDYLHKKIRMGRLVRNYEALNFEAFYFVKGIDWLTENEYRIIVRSNKEIYINLSKALKAIVLGVDFDVNLLPALQTLGVQDAFQLGVHKISGLYSTKRLAGFNSDRSIIDTLYYKR